MHLGRRAADRRKTHLIGRILWQLQMYQSRACRKPLRPARMTI
nr:MAG TPA: hypothetical protein [Caudoviricetes sp.]